MKIGPVYICCLLLGLTVTAGGQEPPPGHVQWTWQAYTLAADESMPFHVDWDQIPVRRWMLLVEGDTRHSYLNLRRQRDASLVYDKHGETRHLVEIPWGEGETLSALLRAGQPGSYAVSLWGPPPDDYLRAYSYDVNRALEALEVDDRTGARAHLLTALHNDPEDAVAQTLLMGLDEAARPGVGPRTALAADPDPAALRRLEEVRRHAAELREEGRYRAAADTLQQTIGPELGAAGVAAIYADLVDLFLDMGNLVQARAALSAASSLGLPDEEAAGLRQRVNDAIE